MGALIGSFIVGFFILMGYYLLAFIIKNILMPIICGFFKVVFFIIFTPIKILFLVVLFILEFICSSPAFLLSMGVGIGVVSLFYV